MGTVPTLPGARYMSTHPKICAPCQLPEQTPPLTQHLHAQVCLSPSTWVSSPEAQDTLPSDSFALCVPSQGHMAGLPSGKEGLGRKSRITLLNPLVTKLMASSRPIPSTQQTSFSPMGSERKARSRGDTGSMSCNGRGRVEG